MNSLHWIYHDASLYNLIVESSSITIASLYTVIEFVIKENIHSSAKDNSSSIYNSFSMIYELTYTSMQV